MTFSFGGGRALCVVRIVLLVFFLFSFSSWAEDPAEPDQVLTSEPELQRVEEQYQEMWKSFQEINKKLGSPGVQKAYEKMKGQMKPIDFSDEKAAASWAKDQQSIEYSFVNIRASWDYKGDYHKVLPPRDPSAGSVKVDSSFSVKATGDFIGMLWKTWPTGKQDPPDYGIERIVLDGISESGIGGESRVESKRGAMICKGETKKISNATFDVSGSALHTAVVTTGPDVAIPGVCAGSIGGGKTDDTSFILSPNPLFWAVMTKKDFETLVRDGYWTKTYPGVEKIHAPAPAPDKLPTDVLISYSPAPELAYAGHLRIEIFLEPRIEGPHYAAVPLYTRPPQPDNAVTLKVREYPGWKVKKIRPVGKVDKVVAVGLATPPPMPTLSLHPKAPGTAQFEIEWTGPRGNTGKSKPFDLTVVQLEFKEAKPCTGFDDRRETTDPMVPALSVCLEKEDARKTNLDILPAGTQIKSRLKVDMAGAFTPSPENDITEYPKTITIKGNKKAMATMTAEVEIDKGVWQKAADLFVDVLPVRELKIQPVLYNYFDFEPPELPLLNVESDLHQACVKPIWLPLKRLSPAELQDQLKLPDDTGINPVMCGERTESAFGQYATETSTPEDWELTAFFVPSILSTTPQPGGKPPLSVGGFQWNKYFISIVPDATKHIASHEVGHYLFGEIYSSMEGAYHTSYPEMLMYHVTATQCDIYQNEWRKAHSAIVK